MKISLLHQAEEEARSLQKKIQTVENELDQTQEALTQVNAKLDEKNKALQNVSSYLPFFTKISKISEMRILNSKRREKEVTLNLYGLWGRSSTYQMGSN